MDPKRIPAILGCLLCLALGPFAARAGETPHDPTVRFRDLSGIVEGIAADVAEGNGGASVVVWAVDVGAHWETGVGDQLARAVEAGFSSLAEKDRPRMAAAVFTGDQVEIRGKPSRDPAALAETFRTMKVQDLGAARDLMAGLRALLGAVPRPEEGGQRHVVLVSMENVDGENDVEGTLRLCLERKAALHVVGRGAYVSDSWWAVRGADGTEPLRLPKGLAVAGPDAPFRELPVGWVFEVTGADNVPPAGFGVWAWCRLASLTGGAYYAYYPGGDDGVTFCSFHYCPFCDQKHATCIPPYVESYLRLLRPDLRCRAEVLSDAATSPIWTAVKAGWDGAAKAGVVRTVHPGFAPSEYPESPKAGSNDRFLGLWQRLVGQDTWAGRARAAQGALGDLKKVVASVERAVEQAAKRPKTDADFRAEAVLKTLEAQLKGVRFNLDQYQLFCIEVQKEEQGRIRLAPNERPLVEGRPDGQVWSTVEITNLFFCHGSGPVREVRWLPGKDTDRFLGDLCDVVDRNLKDHNRTPFEIANRRIALAQFWPVYTPVEGTIKGRRDKEPPDAGAATPSRRPPRGGGGAAGGTAVGTGGGR